MKLSITQIVLGLGILLAMAFSIAWDPTGFYIRVPLGEPGNWKTLFNPDTKEVIATVIAILVLLLGLAIIGVAVTLLVLKTQSEHVEPHSEQNARKKKLAIIQMGLGFLVAVSAFLVTIWGFPTSYTYQLSDSLVTSVNFIPGPQFVVAHRLSLLVFLLGIVSLACGVAQLWSVRPSRVLPTAT